MFLYTAVQFCLYCELRRCPERIRDFLLEGGRLGYRQFVVTLPKALVGRVMRTTFTVGAVSPEEVFATNIL